MFVYPEKVNLYLSIKILYFIHYICTMKRNIAFISFLISMAVIISHDIIPHHHADTAEIEMLSHKPAENHGHNSQKDDNNSRSHIPLHQHLISEGDCINGRYTVSVNRLLKDSNHDFGSLSAICTGTSSHEYFTGFVRIIREPLCSYLIISLNTTRGSPSIS